MTPAELDAIKARAEFSTEPFYAEDVAELLAEVERLREVVDAAVAYTTEPEGSDNVPQYWHELEDTVGRYLRAGLKDGAR